MAFGATRKPGVQVQKDAGCAALMGAGTEYVSIFGKSWDLHVAQVLKTSLVENLQMIRETISYFSDAGKSFFDAEHFFDGYRNNPSYAIQAVLAAEQAGAARIILCDTNGGSFPQEIAAVVEAVKRPAMCRWRFIATTIWTVRWRRASWRLRLVANRCREHFWDMGSAAEMPICRPLFQRCS